MAHYHCDLECFPNRKEVNTIKEKISKAWYPCYKEMKKHGIPEFNSFFKSFQGIKVFQKKTVKISNKTMCSTSIYFTPTLFFFALFAFFLRSPLPRNLLCYSPQRPSCQDSGKKACRQYPWWKGHD